MMLTMTRKTHGKKSQMMLTPMTMAMHARLKLRAHQEGRSMAAIVRQVVGEYLDLEREETQSLYDELEEKFSKFSDIRS